MVGLLFDQLYS